MSDMNSKPPGGAGEKTNFSRPKLPQPPRKHVDTIKGMNSDPSRKYPTGDDCMRGS